MCCARHSQRLSWTLSGSGAIHKALDGPAGSRELVRCIDGRDAAHEWVSQALNPPTYAVAYNFAALTRPKATADQVSFSGAYCSAGILNFHATASRAVRIGGGTRSQ